jgi:Glycosyltransferase 61
MSIFVKFGSEYDCEKYLRTGWSAAETGGFVWSNARHSALVFPRPERRGDWCLSIVLRPFAPKIRPFQLVTLCANGTIIGECIFRKEDKYEFYLSDAAVQRGDELRIDFYHHSPLQPSAADGSHDTRLLSISLLEIEIFGLDGMSFSEVERENMLAAPEPVRWDLHGERNDDNQIVNDALDDKNLQLSALPGIIEKYIRGSGSVIHIRPRLRDAIERKLLEVNFDIASSAAFTGVTNLDIGRHIVQNFAPAFERFLFQSENAPPETELEIFPESRNDLYYPEFREIVPSPITRETRPALVMSASQEASVYVHPFHYVIYDKVSSRTWPGTNLHALSKLVLRYPSVQCAKNIVVLQDRFDGGNISHFLFDSMTRLYHFCAAKPNLTEDTLFILGGWPGEFHRIVIDCAIKDLKLDKSQFLFPRHGYNIEPDGAVYWFSDQATFIHPAQMMHPKSVEVLQKLTRSIEINGEESGRFYISRSDAGLRRVSNELELMAALDKEGFKLVRLADIPAEKQIGLLANASHIVAPHGMGLTHLAFQRGTPTVVELFHPFVSSDTYAFLSRAYGFNYFALKGKETDPEKRDYSVNVEEVMTRLRSTLK